MYRVLCAAFFCMSAVSAFPQDSSDSTFSNPLPGLLQDPPESTSESLESVSLPRNDSTDNIQNSNEVTTPSIEAEESSNTKPEISTAIYDTLSDATERNYASKEVVPQTEAYVPKVKAPKFPSPRFTSKLGYFKNPDRYSSSGQTNFIERTGYRKFRSRCRCEKITNCPKLQITVPRCPEEYFLCCF